MSGGSLNYLYCKEEIDELRYAIPEMEQVERIMIEMGSEDISADIRKLIEYIKEVTDKMESITKKLSPVFKAVEWCQDGDWGNERLIQAIEKYRETDKNEHESSN